MDGLFDLVGGALELLLDVLPFRVTAAICANVAAGFFVVGWVTDHADSPFRPWVSGGAWVVLPFATFAFLLWPRRRRERGPRLAPPAPSRLHSPAARHAAAERDSWFSSSSST